MATIGERLRGRDRELFVGREVELELFDRLLRGDAPERVVHLIGPGGIGKSALIREVSRRADAAGIPTVWIDGRDIPPFPSEIDAALAGVATDAGASLVVFDSYELIQSLDSHLRTSVIPDLPEGTVVVIAARQRPGRGWYEQGWDTIALTLELQPLDARAAASLVTGHGITDLDEAADLVDRCRGWPLALVVGAETGASDSVASSDLADRLLGDEVDPSRLRTLSVAAIARVTTPELLGDVIGEDDPHESYKWLADRSFAEPLAAGITLHTIVAESVRDRLRVRDPVGEGVLRRAIADHLHRRALSGRAGISMELQHLVVDPTVKWGFSSDIGRRYRIDAVKAGDAETVGAILHAVGQDEWWSVTRVFFDDHPELVGIARDPEGGVGGYYVAVAAGNAPQAAHDDPLFGPWLRHARDVLQTSSAVLWREAVDLTGEMGEVTSLLGAGGLLATGIANPRYLYLPIAPEVPAAGAFARRLDAVHVEALDMHAFGLDLECHIVDCGPGGLIGNQRDWIYRETGVAPPVDQLAVDPVDAFRWLRDPSALAHGPDWLGSSPSERHERLESMVRSGLQAFGSTRDDELARSIIESAYLGDNAPHETIARRLNLSRSSYFRRLQAATDRVGAELTARNRRS